MGARLSSFQRLALWTTAVTYLLILVGGLVRASGAGLGCPDWPRCFGSWIPPTSAAALPPPFDPSQFNPALMWTEYCNRLLGVSVGFLILGATISAWRHHRHDARILWPTGAALLLTGFEGWLGGRVVAHELAPWIVTTHMLVALLIVSLLLYATFHAFGDAARPVALDAHEAAARQPIVRTVLVLVVLTLAQIALGTQVRGRIDDALAAGAGRAGALVTVGAIDAFHRTSALAVLGLALVAMLSGWAKAPHHRPIATWSYVTVGLSTVQVALGVVMAYVALLPAAQVAHLTVASLLLGAETVLLLILRHR